MTIVETKCLRLIIAKKEGETFRIPSSQSRGNAQSSSDKIKPHRGTLLKAFYSSLRAVKGETF